MRGRAGPRGWRVPGCSGGGGGVGRSALMLYQARGMRSSGEDELGPCQRHGCPPLPAPAGDVTLASGHRWPQRTTRLREASRSARLPSPRDCGPGPSARPATMPGADPASPQPGRRRGPRRRGGRPSGAPRVSAAERWCRYPEGRTSPAVGGRDDLPGACRHPQPGHAFTVPDPTAARLDAELEGRDRRSRVVDKADQGRHTLRRAPSRGTAA